MILIELKKKKNYKNYLRTDLSRSFCIQSLCACQVSTMDYCPPSSRAIRSTGIFWSPPHGYTGLPCTHNLSSEFLCRDRTVWVFLMTRPS